jgi:hypothetical protein
MKTISLKKIIALGLTLAGVAFIPSLHAQTKILISGGNASSGVLFDRATNLFGGTFTATYGTSSSTIRTYQGNIPGYPGLGSVTLYFNLSGAVGGLIDISQGNPETTAAGSPDASFIPTVVDSSASPEASGVDASQFSTTTLPTYVVPYVFIKNSTSADTAGITNLTQRQAALLESSGATIPASFFGGNSTNVIYFVGRNKDSAVRTEVDLGIYASGFQTYTTNGLGHIVQDTTSLDLEGNVDPGQTSGSTLANIIKNNITNGIGTVAAQNIASGTTALAFEGVSYSTNNVQNGSYPLWGYENYYYKTSISANQLQVLNLLYQSVTNASFQSSNPNFVNKFIPLSALQVTRSIDGGPISLK